MDFESIILKKENHVATITLNRPHHLNALTFDMMDEIKAALRDIDDDDDMRVMVITGAGKAFCASADIEAEGGAVGKGMMSDFSSEEVRLMIKRRAQAITRGIIYLQKPTIAMVNGLALGDGFDWVLSCDIRIGSEHSKFMNAYVKMGLIPGTGGLWLYPRIMPLGKALELLYTGDWLYAEEAFRYGVLNKLVPADKLEEETMTLAGQIAQGPPAALRLMKMQTYKGLEIGLDTALELAADGEVLMLTTQDHIEAVTAWMEKRAPKYTGK